MTRHLRPILGCPILRPVLCSVWGCSCGVTCPTASTSELDGTPSRILITTCLCDAIEIAGEGNVWDPLSLTVDGDSSTWTITGLDSTDGDKCYTWEVSGGPLSYGQAITLHYDHDGLMVWINMTGDVDISVSNTIAAPVILLTLPSFDATTGRLSGTDPLSLYNTRTSTNSTFINSDGYVETAPANSLIYTGSRIVRNIEIQLTDGSSYMRAQGTTPPAFNPLTTYDGKNCSSFTLDENSDAGFNGSRVEGRNDAGNGRFTVYTNGVYTWRMDIAFSRPLTGSESVTFYYTGEIGFNAITVISSSPANSISWTTIRGNPKTHTGSVGVNYFVIHQGSSSLNSELVVYFTERQAENVAPKAIQNSPGEYESVGVGIGDELQTNGTFDADTAWTKGTGWTITGGKAVATATTLNLEQASVLEVGKSYILTYDATVTGGNFTTNAGTTRSSTGSYTDRWVAASTTLKFDGGTAFTGTIDNVVLKRATTGYGIYNRANGNTVDANGVVTDTPGSVLATAPVLRHAPAATNVIKKSDDLTGYTVRGAASITANNAVSYDGTTTAEKIIIGPNFGDDCYLFEGNGTLPNDTAFSLSLYIKKTTASGQITISSPSGAGFGSWTVNLALLGSGWERLTKTHAAVTVNNAWISNATGNVGVQFIRATSSTTFTFHVGGIQAEVGSVATPLVNTTGSSASRLIDSILHLYSASVFDQNDGYLIIDWETSSSHASSAVSFALLSIRNGTSGPCYWSAGDKQFVAYDGTNSTTEYEEFAANKKYRIAVRWNTDINELQIGTKNVTDAGAWQWDASIAAYDGAFEQTDSLITLFRSCDLVVKVHDVQVWDSDYSAAQIEVRHP